ncbi:Uncharacterised protein [Mycobacterium tuberculosis]|nr:Uncharacterised protein [Mycobacterium tuberculosis]
MLNASWKPLAWRSSASMGSALGSTAPSRIIARTRCGNSSAYAEPIRVPYE